MKIISPIAHAVNTRGDLSTDELPKRIADLLTCSQYIQTHAGMQVCQTSRKVYNLLISMLACEAQKWEYLPMKTKAKRAVVELATTSIRVYPSTLKKIREITFKREITSAELIKELVEIGGHYLKS